MSRRRRSSSVRNQHFYVDRFIKRSVVNYGTFGLVPIATSKIRAYKKRQNEKKIAKRLKHNLPNMYNRLPKCKTVRERIRRAFFGFLKRQMPLAGKGGTKKTLRQKHSDRFTPQPCRKT